MHSGLSVTLAHGEAEKRGMESAQANGLAWAIHRWNEAVKHCPMVNVHRRALDRTWREVIRYFGGNPEELVGPDHDTLLMRQREERAWKPPAPSALSAGGEQEGSK